MASSNAWILASSLQKTAGVPHPCTATHNDPLVQGFQHGAPGARALTEPGIKHRSVGANVSIVPATHRFRGRHTNVPLLLLKSHRVGDGRGLAITQMSTT